jgi:hypothetical protein
MKKIKILLTFFVATLLILGILSQLSVWYDNRTAEPAKRLLQGEVPRGDSEGTDALWLMPYDIPDAAERRQIMAKLGNKVLDDDQLPESLRQRKLITKDEEGQSLDCISRNNDGAIVADCLQNVRAHADAYRAVVAKYAKLFDNADRVSQYSNLDVRALNISDAFPKYHYLVYQTTPAAVDWLDGKPEAAFARICRNIRTGKTLQQSRGGLLPAMIGTTIIQNNTRLAAAMLAEQPQWAGKLPENCADAFAPTADNAENYCRIMQFEYHYMDNFIANLPTQLSQEMPAWLVPVLFSPEHSRTLASKQFAFGCEPPAQQAFAQDLPVWAPQDAQMPQTFWQQYGSLACLRNALGCRFINGDYGGDVDPYARRLQDTQMQQRAFQAALALYRLPENQRTAELPNVLARYGSPSRELHYDAEAKAIVFTPYQHHVRFILNVPLALPQGQQNEMTDKLPKSQQ